MELFFVILEIVIVIITLTLMISLEELNKKEKELTENMLEIEKEYSGKLEEEIEFLRKELEKCKKN